MQNVWKSHLISHIVNVITGLFLLVFSLRNNKKSYILSHFCYIEVYTGEHGSNYKCMPSCFFLPYEDSTHTKHDDSIGGIAFSKTDMSPYRRVVMCQIKPRTFIPNWASCWGVLL